MTEQQNLFPASERFDNGARIRADGRGDAWANEHLRRLYSDFLMQDVDGYFGFDRKSTEEAAFSERNAVSRAFYLWLCRTIGRAQPPDKQPRFFLVIGSQRPPWDMIEIDTTTGEVKGERVRLDAADWGRIWETLGLAALRRGLLSWLHGRA